MLRRRAPDLAPNSADLRLALRALELDSVGSRWLVKGFRPTNLCLAAGHKPETFLLDNGGWQSTQGLPLVSVPAQRQGFQTRISQARRQALTGATSNHLIEGGDHHRLDDVPVGT